MKQLLVFIALGGAAALSFAQASAPAIADKAPSAQQNKMAACNQQAGEMKGDERKAFMKQCLSAKPDGKTTQQNKMKTCNDAAGQKALQGEQRKAFMSSCLKG